MGQWHAPPGMVFGAGLGWALSRAAACLDHLVWAQGGMYTGAGQGARVGLPFTTPPPDCWPLTTPEPPWPRPPPGPLRAQPFCVRLRLGPAAASTSGCLQSASSSTARRACSWWRRLWSSASSRSTARRSSSPQRRDTAASTSCGWVGGSRGGKRGGANASDEVASLECWVGCVCGVQAFGCQACIVRRTVPRLQARQQHSLPRSVHAMPTCRGGRGGGDEDQCRC